LCKFFAHEKTRLEAAQLFGGKNSVIIKTFSVSIQISKTSLGKMGIYEKKQFLYLVLRCNH